MTLERDDGRLADEDQMTDDEAAEAAVIRADIEETRVEIGGTLNELGNRLEPSHLVDQAKENVREATIGRVEETAKGMSDMVIETIKSNPIPAALAGAGLALLWANRKSGNGHETSRYYGATSSYENQGPDVAGKAREAASSVGHTVGQVGESVGQTVGQVGDNVGQTVSNVGGQLDRFMHSSPLAMGAIAIGAGAVVGGLLPETPQEREMLGDAGRQIGTAVRDTVDQASAKAEETLDRTEEKVGAIT